MAPPTARAVDVSRSEPPQRMRTALASSNALPRPAGSVRGGRCPPAAAAAALSSSPISKRKKTGTGIKIKQISQSRVYQSLTYGACMYTLAGLNEITTAESGNQTSRNQRTGLGARASVATSSSPRAITLRTKDTHMRSTLKSILLLQQKYERFSLFTHASKFSLSTMNMCVATGTNYNRLISHNVGSFTSTEVKIISVWLSTLST